MYCVNPAPAAGETCTIADATLHSRQRRAHKGIRSLQQMVALIRAACVCRDSAWSSCLSRFDSLLGHGMRSALLYCRSSFTKLHPGCESGLHILRQNRLVRMMAEAAGSCAETAYSSCTLPRNDHGIVACAADHVAAAPPCTSTACSSSAVSSRIHGDRLLVERLLPTQFDATRFVAAARGLVQQLIERSAAGTASSA